MSKVISTILIFTGVAVLMLIIKKTVLLIINSTYWPVQLVREIRDVVNKKNVGLEWLSDADSRIIKKAWPNIVKRCKKER